MIIDKLAAGPEQYRDPLSGFWYGPIGRLTTAGITVTEDVAMTLSACWAATRILAAPSGYLPFNLYRRLDGGGSEIATEHPVYRLVHDAPNREMGSMIWRCMGVAQQVNSGNCYAEIERTGRGQPVALWPIHHSRVEPKRNERGELYYEVRPENGRLGTPVTIPADDMFHVPSMMTEDGIVGKGVIRHARETIGQSLATEQYGSSWFKSGGRLSAVVKHPRKMDREARENFRQEWEEIYGSPSGSRVGILFEGMEYMPIASDPEDSQFISSRQYNVEEVARWYGVPPHLIQQLQETSNNSIEELGVEFVRYSLLPWQKLWEQEAWRKLLSDDEKAKYYFKFNVEALERGVLSTRTEALAQQFFNGALTLNQWMEMEDRNPIGELGDQHFVQAAMIPLEMAVNDNPNKVQPPEQRPNNPDDKRKNSGQNKKTGNAEEAAWRMLAQVTRRMVAKESNQARREAKKAGTFCNWLDDFYAKLALTFHEETCSVYAVLEAIQETGECAEDRASHFLDAHCEAHKEDLLKAAECQAGELPQRVEDVVTSWTRK